MTLGLSTKNSKSWNFIALGLVLSLVGVLFFGEKLSADDDLQNKCKKTLERDLPVEEYTTWIAPLTLEQNNNSNPLS